MLGASAGGVQALSQVVAGLPHDLPAAVFVVLHVAPHGTSAMPAILSRASSLEATHPRDGERIRPGRIYVAPPDRHLVLEPGRVRLSRGPTENSHRPAVDVLFRTASQAYGRRVVGVVLTGNLDDGTAGLAMIKKHKGIAVVQDPSEADYPGMPRSAVANVAVDHVLSLSSIAPLLVRLAHEPIVEEDPPPHGKETPDMKEQVERGKTDEDPGVPSGFTCPECHGALWEKHDQDLVHFRCRTGHAFSPESLLAQQTAVLEDTLWAAVRALQENAALARRMEGWMRKGGMAKSEDRYSRHAEDAEKHAEVLRKILVHGGEELD